jgi:hypothetical protein
LSRYLTVVALALAVGCGSTISEREWQEIKTAKVTSNPGDVELDGVYKLRNLIAPILRNQEVVHTVELFMMADLGGMVLVGIVPKHVQDTPGRLWHDCHETSLWKSDSWLSGPDIARGDGHWMHVEAEYKQDMDVVSRSLIEWVSFRVSLDTLRELVAAERSGGQVCDSKFEFSADQKLVIATLVSKL